MDIERIEELIRVLESSTAEEISVTRGGFGVSIRRGTGGTSASRAPGGQTQDIPAPAARGEPPPSDHYICAPMVGIFHKVDGMPMSGAKVARGDVVGTIESMKLLNDVVSDVSGTLCEILVEEGAPVEYGQPLCRIQPERPGE